MGFIPCVEVNNGFVRVLKDRLLLRRIRLPFRLIGRFARFEIDGSAEVFLRVQNVENRRAVPVISGSDLRGL